MKRLQMAWSVGLGMWLATTGAHLGSAAELPAGDQVSALLQQLESDDEQRRDTAAAQLAELWTQVTDQEQASLEQQIESWRRKREQPEHALMQAICRASDRAEEKVRFLEANDSRYVEK